MNQFTLSTQRLVLRDFTSEDLPHYIAMTQHSKYRRCYREEDCSLSKAVELVGQFIKQAKQTPRSAYQLAVCYHDSEQLIGTVGLRLNRDFQASIGFGLSPEYWGAGLIFESISELIDFGFNELGVHRIFAETLSENQAAVALCQRLGMRREAVFCEQTFFKEKWWDTSVFALLSSEWQIREVPMT